MQIVPLAPDHAHTAARLHIAGQPGTFLTSLGSDVLTVFYAALSQSPAGFGFAAVENGQALGFVSATTSVGKLFLEMGTKHIVRFLPPLLKRYAQQPKLMLQSMQTVLYPFLVSEKDSDAFRAGDATIIESDSAPAELLSIMVEPGARSSGIGAQLLSALDVECRNRGIDLLDVTVDAGNAGARRFYERHNFVWHHNFDLYGREMCQYKLQLSKVHKKQ